MQEGAQDTYEMPRVGDVVPTNNRPDIVEYHVADPFGPVRAVEQVAPQ